MRETERYIVGNDPSNCGVFSVSVSVCLCICLCVRACLCVGMKIDDYPDWLRRANFYNKHTAREREKNGNIIGRKRTANNMYMYRHTFPLLSCLFYFPCLIKGVSLLLSLQKNHHRHLALPTNNFFWISFLRISSYVAGLV